MECAITSDDLILLLDKLKQFQQSSSNVYTWLYGWNLHGNWIDDSGANALMQCKLFPLMRGADCRGKNGVYYLTLSANPVSGEMVKMLDQEWQKRFRVRYA